MDEKTARQPRIALIDSDPASGAQRCALMAPFGWDVVLASSPLDAVALLRARPADLVLLRLPPDDVVVVDLPRMLRQVAGGTYLLVVALTAHPNERDCCRLLDSGVDDILPDAISPCELRARLRALLRIKELQDALDASRRAMEEVLHRERDLLQRVQTANAHLTELALTDPLTHLHNIRYFQRFLDDELKIARRYGHTLSLLALDMDHFKQVNDRYGHPAGDFVLKEFSVILRQNVRESDVVARTGGEEFGIILPKADRVHADHFARRIREAVAGHAFHYGSARIKVTCSLGVASFMDAEEIRCPEELVYFADQALLMAKQSGRNCVVHWSELAAVRRNRLRAQFVAPRAAAPEPLDAVAGP